MKRTAFKKPTLEEVKTKQATQSKARTPAKRAKLTSKTIKPKRANKSKVKTKTQAQLKKELDTIFSIYIRQKFSKECYTCLKVTDTLQCGHFISRQYLTTRWDENNCRPQCVGCNIFGNGKPLDFEERLKKELGSNFVENMKASRHISLKLDRHWYVDKLAFYKPLVGV